MRFLIAFVALAVMFTAAFAQETPKTTLKLYFEEPSKQTEAKNLLREMDRTEIAKSLSDYLENEETVEAALDLATDLKVPLNLKEQLQIESLRDRAVNLILITQDEKKIEELYKDEELRPIVLASFLKYGLPPKLIKKIKADAFKEKDTQRRDELLDVVRYQMNLDSSAEELKENWNKLWKEFESVSVAQEFKGWNILQYGDVTISNTRPSGFNTRIMEKGEVKLNLRAERWHKKSWKMKGWLYLPKGSDAEMSVRSSIGIWSVNTTEDKWQITSRSANQIQRKDNEWLEVVISITENGKSQLMSLTIGGNELFPSSGLVDGVEEVKIVCTKGELILGSLSIEE